MKEELVKILLWLELLSRPKPTNGMYLLYYGIKNSSEFESHNHELKDLIFRCFSSLCILQLHLWLWLCKLAKKM